MGGHKTISSSSSRLLPLTPTPPPPPAWISPTSYVDPDSKWNQEFLSYDGNIATPADQPSAGYSKFLELYFSVSFSCSKIRVFVGEGLPPSGPVSVVLGYYSAGLWQPLFAGSIAANEWIELTIPDAPKTISAIEIRRSTSHSKTLYLFEIQAWRL